MALSYFAAGYGGSRPLTLHTVMPRRRVGGKQVPQIERLVEGEPQRGRGYARAELDEMKAVLAHLAWAADYMRRLSDRATFYELADPAVAQSARGERRWVYGVAKERAEAVGLDWPPLVTA